MFGVDDVKSVSVMEGDSVTLNSGRAEIQTHDLILWTFRTNRSLLAKIHGKTSKIFNGPDGRFRDRLKLDHQTGSLTITNTRTTDSGLYQIIIRTNRETRYRFNVTVEGESHLHNNNSSFTQINTYKNTYIYKTNSLLLRSFSFHIIVFNESFILSFLYDILLSDSVILLNVFIELISIFCCR